MAIWRSIPHIGTDLGRWYDGETGVEITNHPQGGNVLSYAEGFSNHHPDLTGEHERPAAIALADIAPWCVPGHEDSEDWTATGTWLRLEVAAPEVVNSWNDPATTETHAATVVLDETAARTLRDQLDEWLALDKKRPAEILQHQAAEAAGHHLAGDQLTLGGDE